MKKRILALILVLVMMLSAVGCSNVGYSTANNNPGDFIMNAIENTDEKYSDSISSITDILSSAMRGGSVKLSYNDSHYSVDNILYMDCENANYTNLLDGQIYGKNMNLIFNLNKSDLTMWSDPANAEECLFTYDLYGDQGYNAYTFKSDLVATMFGDKLNAADEETDNPTNFDWLLYQLTRLMQINEEFREDLSQDIRDILNEKFTRYSAESKDVDIDGNDVDCVVLKYNLDEYDIADLLDIILNDYLDYFYYMGITGVKREGFIITDAIEAVKEYVEKSFADINFTLVVAEDTKAIVSLNVEGSVNIAGESATIKGDLNLGRVASYFTPVTGEFTVTGKETHTYKIKTDASESESSDSYRIYAETVKNGTSQSFVDMYLTYDKSAKKFSLYSNTSGNIIAVDGNLEIEEGESFKVVATYVKLGNDEYYPDFSIYVKADANAPKIPSNPCVVSEEVDEETGEVTFSAYDAFMDIMDNEVKGISVFQDYSSVKAIVDKIIRNSIFKDAAEGVGDFITQTLTPAVDQYKSQG